MVEEKSSTAKIRAAKTEARKLEEALRWLVAAALLHLRDLDAEMKKPSDAARGQRIGRICNRLEYAVDQARYSVLHIDFRSDPQAKQRETAQAAKAFARIGPAADQQQGEEG